MTFYVLGAGKKGLSGVRTKRSKEVLLAWEAARRAEELRERRRTETVTLDVEIHAACGGQIQYTSYFRDTAPPSQLVGGGHHPHLTEFVTCACAKCGSAITHPEHLARYAKQMTTHRNRKTK